MFRIFVPFVLAYVFTRILNAYSLRNQLRTTSEPPTNLEDAMYFLAVAKSFIQPISKLNPLHYAHVEACVRVLIYLY